jgi:ribonuclease VapC
MFIDASALCSMLTDEDEARELLARLQRGPKRMTSPLVVWEIVVSVARILDMPFPDTRKAVEDYLELMNIQIIAVPPETGAIAIDAFDRYGKRQHPADLNFGDCFAYACARHYRAPLLFKGNDFPQTDIEAA